MAVLFHFFQKWQSEILKNCHVVLRLQSKIGYILYNGRIDFENEGSGRNLMKSLLFALYHDKEIVYKYITQSRR